MEKINQTLFLFMNASDHPSAVLVALAQGLADYVIWAVPVVLILGWLRGDESVRRLMLLAFASSALGLLINQSIGLVWQHPRPFMIGLGNTLIAHAADSSFPSDHLTVLWAVSFGFLTHRRWRSAGILLMFIGLPVAWARIYLGVHFPLDMVGALIVAGFSVWLCMREERQVLSPVFHWLSVVEWILLAPLIRQGWIKRQRRSTCQASHLGAPRPPPMNTGLRTLTGQAAQSCPVLSLAVNGRHSLLSEVPCDHDEPPKD